MISPTCISAFVVAQTPEGLSYLFLRRSGKFLFGTWQPVTGKIEKGETARLAALREIQEETGLIPIQLVSADVVETFYMETHDQICFVPTFLAFVEKGPVYLSPDEHDQYEWLCFEEAYKRLSFSEQRRALSVLHSQWGSHREVRTRTGVYGLVCKEGKLLLICQKKGVYLGKWDFPGGKIEPGEGIEEALRREFSEELGCEFERCSLLENLATCVYADTYTLHQIGLIYRVEQLSALEKTPCEFEPHWVSPEEISSENATPFVKQIAQRTALFQAADIQQSSEIL